MFLGLGSRGQKHKSCITQSAVGGTRQSESTFLVSSPVHAVPKLWLKNPTFSQSRQQYYGRHPLLKRLAESCQHSASRFWSPFVIAKKNQDPSCSMGASVIINEVVLDFL